MDIYNYIQSISQRFKLGNATEHTFRGDLQQLIERLVPGIQATNEPKRQKCGAPDYIITKKEIPIGYIEAKDIGDLDLEGKKANKEQFNRYKSSLENLIFTDYLSFYRYSNGELIDYITIAEITPKGIKPIESNFASFENLIKDFCTQISQTIKSPKKLAEMMATKARLLSDVIERALTNDQDLAEDSTLRDQMTAFKQILIHDITPKAFADVYAQTIAYGMFAARLHDPTLPTFSRQEAAELIPKSNPFLRKLFGYIAGPDIDDRIKWIVDSLVDIFLATDVAEILSSYGKATRTEDPIIHFYETFLAEYDPKLRKARGVWYTPQPVVNFIVRAVDDILKTEFGLSEGLADTSKTKIKVQEQGQPKPVEKEVHKVQILDPATGTATFLAEVIKQVHQKFEGQQGIWSHYVEEHLLPRLNGFEILMASYAMAHLKLDLLLTETGYKPKKEQRFRVYLTNSLEEAHPDTGTLFANWLSAEANEANHIKRDTPVMCVIGNPPYSVSSTNKGEWIEGLVADYKKDLNERNIQPLSDDYIKFIRYGQYLIDKTGEGVLAFISNNSFIDGLIHRQMRKHLLESFDSIYILDLHGSTKRREKTNTGKVDKNVFDIQTGVSINIFIKHSNRNKKKAKLFKYDLKGDRETKYNFLNLSSLKKIDWVNLEELDDKYSFKEFESNQLNGSNSFKIDEVFRLSASGITTERDNLTIQFEKNYLEKIYQDFIKLTEIEIREKYELGKDGRDWKVSTAKKDLQANKPQIKKLLYRPFDFRLTLFTGKSKGFHSYPRENLMSHLINQNNYCLIIGRQGQAIGGNEWNIVLITNSIFDSNIFYRGRGTGFPLFLKSPSNEFISNMSSEFRNKFKSRFPSIELNYFDLLDYIYAVLHSPTYREKYKEFLKIDFPRVPYPKDTQTFLDLVQLGSQLREIHLMESPVLNKFITQYPEDGTNEVEKPEYKNGNVYINATQYFANVPEIPWNFYIGGYQPAQKWLKDRKGRTLSFEDIIHYQKIIVALTETNRLMQEIDKIEIEVGEK